MINSKRALCPFIASNCKLKHHKQTVRENGRSLIPLSYRYKNEMMDATFFFEVSASADIDNPINLFIAKCKF
jgi:hypothetical protein